MKSRLLVLGAIPFLLAACGEKKPEPCPDGSHVDENHDTYCDICGTQYIFDINHATKCKGEPNAAFQMGVGEVKTIEATLDPVPYRYSEREFTWENSNSSVVSMVINQDKTAQATITALKTGTVKLTATNVYNPDLKHEFNITVINYDSESMYLWQYNSDAGDRAQFGYDSKIMTAGTAKGTAVLGGLKWNYERSEAISLQSDSGALGFGKGKAPETSVKLVAKSDRTIKRVSLETASANGLANVVVKVGDNVVINKATPVSAEGIQEISSDLLDNLAGDISIEFTTPEFDKSREEDITYKAPGAVYLKSIFIEYSNKYSYKTNKKYDFAAKYAAGAEDPDFSKLTGTAKELVISDNDFEVTFEKISSDKDKSAAVTNGYIDVKVKNNSDIVKMVEFEYENYSTANTYNLYQSFIGGEPYFDKVGGNKSGTISFVIYDKYVSSIRLIPAGTSKVGLKSLSIKTIEGERATVKSVGVAEGAAPDRTVYCEGEKFDPYGLGPVFIEFENADIETVSYPSENLVWYDGQSWENPSDHSGASEILKEGTTYVVAELLGKEIKVEIEEVTVQNSTFTKIKDTDDLVTGNYLITAPAKNALLRSTADDFKAGAAVDILSDCDFGDSITINYLYEECMFNLSKNGSTYQIKSIANDRMIGMTKSGVCSSAKSPEYKDWTITIDEDGIATLEISDVNGNVKYFGFGKSAFNLANDNQENVALYKLD